MAQVDEEPEPAITAVEFLADIANIFQVIATNLRHNRIGRSGLQKLLCDYAARAESDGRLINASRQDPLCVNRGLFLAYNHMELLSWVANNNYTITATSVKWYSWRKVLSKYRLPLFSIPSQTAELQVLMKNIERTAELVYSDLEENHISIPPTSIKYPKVPHEQPMGPSPETIHNLLRRGSIARQRLIGQLSA